MSDRTDALAHVLFNKPTFEEFSLQEADNLTRQYPYFSVAQLLLLQKTPSGSNSYTNQLHRTALFFSNPLELQKWLQPEQFETSISEPKLFQNPIPALAETNKEEEAPEIQETTGEENVISQPESAKQIPLLQTEALAVAPPAQEREAPEAPVITFEPYHTVDYFASQGIKLSQQEAGNDKLGKQLKSFTEWLKTMKRLPEVAITQNTDAAGERNVENLAAQSLDTADVVTESMAEVWLKQGNKQKATDVYRKLSLQNPAKNAYFAAKIEALKQP